MDRKAELEQQYIALLEKRIAALETLNNSGKTDIPTPPESTAAPDDQSKPESAEPIEGKGSEDAPKEPEPAPEKEKEKDTEDAKSPNKSSRIREYISKWNPESLVREDVEQDIEVKAEPKTEESNDIAYIYRKHMSDETPPKYSHSEIEIVSIDLRKLLAKYLTHLADQLLDEGRFDISSPFAHVVYNWDALVAEAGRQNIPDEEDSLKQTREDLAKLLKHISSSAELEPYFRARDSQLASKSITYEHIWTLFPPGALVYTKPFLNEVQIMKSYYISLIRPMEGGKPTKEQLLYCVGFDWDGEQFQRLWYTFKIKSFEGSKPVNALPVYPVKYYSDGQQTFESDLKPAMIKRGRDFMKLCVGGQGTHFLRYDGIMMADKYRARSGDEDDEDATNRSYDDRDSSGVTFENRKINEKVMIDNLSYLRTKNRQYGGIPLGSLETEFVSDLYCHCDDCEADTERPWEILKDPGEEPNQAAFGDSEDRLLLCPPKVFGCITTTGKWGQLSLKSLTDINGDNDGDIFENKLELKREYKDLLSAFIENHQKKDIRASVEDFIDNKGRGLVILLHGPPGVGKTLTAESIALKSGRPLLNVSVADIGMKPERAEASLSKTFELAARWKAVLLLDEADVFLESRVDSNEANRNALVSVLLRVLEYYNGIIILTTNPITSLDVAVQSRIHLAIQYQSLDPKQKENIFRTFLDKLPAEEIEDRPYFDRQLAKNCKKWDINGRQIRNIVSAGQALARFKKEKLSFERLEDAYETTNAFFHGLERLTISRRNRNEAGGAN